MTASKLAAMCVVGLLAVIPPAFSDASADLVKAEFRKAQKQNKRFIAVVHTGTDSVGRQLVYSLREKIAGSNLLYLSNDDNCVHEALHDMCVSIVSADQSTDLDQRNHASAFAVNFERPFYYFPANYKQEKFSPAAAVTTSLISVGLQVIFVGSSKVEIQAQDLVADIERKSR